jgi:NADPH2:quinone reductase
MRAARISELGRPPEPAEVPEPTGETVFEIAAVALNPIDVNVGAGRHYVGPPPLPYTPGCEGAGRAPDGTRVYLFGGSIGTASEGLLSERAAAPADLAIPLPDDADDPLAAACGIAGLAGWLPLAWRAPVRESDRVLVLGATGTVGLVAVQTAKLLGAAHVVAAGRNRDRLARAAELGADETVVLGEADDLAAALKEASGGDGPTLIVDPLWGPPAAAALQAAAPRFRLVQLGQSAGAEVPLASAPIRGKSGEILGHTNFAVPRDELREHYLTLLRHAAAGDIAIDIETYPLERVAEAWQRQAEGPAAKIVVTL